MVIYPTEPQILPLKGISVEVNLQDDQTVEVMIKLTDNSVSVSIMFINFGEYYYLKIVFSVYKATVRSKNT